ncbi:hypothetical protein [Anaeromyxobacter oryzae]|uniref:Secreted protein n=1 Tax=Anaeromyxobacter oryzae TaxID=2918170 RepID=A0ABM7WQF2_9BACT|nr:hypothetical protein [Anaeromyxobacter oryzae]BDG01696.1 hypothetical protein AMOR_06920 [Anaeromyxobacter oryzae]
MRSVALLLLAALVASAAPARADEDRPRRPVPSRPRAHERVAVAPPMALLAAPAPGRAAPVPAPYPRRVVASGVAFAAPAPFWSGWGWGWGYYPLYPRYPTGHAPEYGYPETDPDQLHVRLSASGAGMSDGGALGLALAIDGRSAGMNASFDGLDKDGVTGLPGQDHHPVGWGSAHVTWSVLSDEVARVRFEVGGSMLSLPSAGATAAGAPWAGKVLFGPDLGVSGQLGVVGPIGLEGHVRVTPLPVPVLDTRVALALRAGPFAVTGGWRTVHVAGDGVDAPVLDFRGPELGVSVMF